MKNYTRVALLIVLGLTMIFVLSCSKDDKPTTPNFEDFAPYVWDYDHVLWFDVDYDYTNAKLGNALAGINLSAKGEDADVILKINNVPVDFQYVESYTQGKFYSDAHVELNTNQQVTYEINNNGKKYTGTIDVGELPDEVDGAFPDFIYANNYAPTWSIFGDIDPKFQMIYAGVAGENQSREYSRQIDGDERNHLLLSSFWQGIGEVDYFNFDVSAILYKLRNSNKVLTVGVSYDSYYWWADWNKAETPSPKAKLADVMEMIHKDMQ